MQRSLQHAVAADPCGIAPHSGAVERVRRTAPGALQRPPQRERSRPAAGADGDPPGGRRPGQGRLSGHAVPRAAQPARGNSDCGPDHPPWAGGPGATRLEQILTNLLDNAAKYTPPKGHIAVIASREENHVVLRVRDTGLGISPEMLPRVFDLFAQADPSLAHSQGGLGIGLTLVQKLTELHDGTVTVHSEGLGRGTEVVVRLPLGTPSQMPGAPVTERRSRSRHVLVIEDNPDAREMLRTTLEVDGHRVEVAEDGPQGVAMALSSRPDVVLVDIGLPGLNGYEVAKQVRALFGRQVRLIAVTGYGRPEDRRRTEEAGFDTHLTKPVSSARIAEAVEGG